MGTTLSEATGMKSPIAKRSIVLAGRKTSVTVETAFWTGLKEVASARHLTLSALVTNIDSGRTGNLSSAIRVIVLGHYRDMISTPAVSQSARAETHESPYRRSVPRAARAEVSPTSLDELLADKSFDPEYLAVLRQAFRGACADLGISENGRHSQAFVAKRIMALADGRRDAEAIRRAVVSFLSARY